MLKEILEAINRMGLVMYPDKTKILTNDNYEHWHGNELVMVNNIKIEILKSEASTIYLAWTLCFETTQDVELENRIKKGWAEYDMEKWTLLQKVTTKFKFEII